MYIIFGDAVKNLPDSFTVLELDTFRTPNNEKNTAWCVVGNIPLAEFPNLDAYKKVHEDLMQAYRDRNWEYCTEAIQGLRSQWNGELESFYEHLLQRITDYQQNPPPPEWDGSLLRL
jgi:adenylate cyclase